MTTQDETGLRAAAERVIDCWDHFDAKYPFVSALADLRAALAANPAPAGLYPGDPNSTGAYPAPAGLDERCKELIAGLEVRGITFDQFAAALAANPAPAGPSSPDLSWEGFATDPDALAIRDTFEYGGGGDFVVIHNPANPAPAGLDGLCDKTDPSEKGYGCILARGHEAVGLRGHHWIDHKMRAEYARLSEGTERE